MKKNTAFKFLERFENIISFGGGHVTALLYCGDPPILFDPGVSAFGPFYLKKIYEHALQPEKLIIALTHAHFDHCGAASYLSRKITSIKVTASPRASEILQRHNAVDLICRLNAEYEQGMEQELKNEDVTFRALHVDYKLSNGDRIPLSNGTACEVIETPGHTRDSLSYFMSDTGVLVIGDAAGACEGGFMHSPFLTSYEDYIRSIEKLQTLKPTALCIAHSGIVVGSDVPRYFAEALTAAIEYKEMIEKYLDEYDGDTGKVVRRITAEEYDAQQNHIQKRQPFILNLQAKVNAVAQLRQ